MPSNLRLEGIPRESGLPGQLFFQSGQRKSGFLGFLAPPCGEAKNTVSNFRFDLGVVRDQRKQLIFRIRLAEIMIHPKLTRMFTVFVGNA